MYILYIYINCILCFIIEQLYSFYSAAEEHVANKECNFEDHLLYYNIC